jgi:glutamate-1-semialdehyde 2,1-aminomutase
MESALQNARSEFVQRHPASQRLHQLALQSLPGGNTRTLLHTAPFPVFMYKGEGCQVWDEDGNKYESPSGPQEHHN